MDITIELVKREEKEILENIIEKYCYEFSQYNNRDVNDSGLYGYDDLDCYWDKENWYPFFIKVDNKLAGFVMFNDDPESNKYESNYGISDFFILYKYRRNGIGQYCVKHILDKYKGKWQIKFHSKNEISKKFWVRTIDEYTKGKYEIIKDDPEMKYEDGEIRYIVLFEA
jgi:predicted acetyltransferase